MAGLDNLNSSPMRRMTSQLRSLNTAPAATNTAIGRDGMEVYDGGVITIINGGLDVTGTATISGTLTGDGTFTWSGPFNQSGVSTFTGNVNLNGPTGINGALTVAGNTTVTGTFNVNGAMKTTSTLSVEGVTTLKNDLNVTTGGKIKVGTSMTLDPSVSSGAVVFSNGAQVFTDASSIQMFKGGSVCKIEDAEAFLLGGGNYVRVTSGGILMQTLPAAPSGSTPNVYIDGTGKLFQII